MSDWNPTSYKDKNLLVKQQPDYTGQDDVLKSTLSKIQSLPPLVQIEEIQTLRARLARCVEGSAFLLQGGDCAEIFSECKPASIDAKLKILLQMSLVLMWGTGKEIVRVGRIAGQYAKPRSNPTEKSKTTGKEIPVFKGDIINGYTEEERQHRPERLLDAYFHSSTTLNYIRGRLSSGWADLHHSAKWDLNFTEKADKRAEYKQIIASLEQALKFMSAANIGSSDPNVSGVGFFTSHEGLILDYEAAMTKQGDNGAFYDTSAHFVWIGDRTRGLDDGHVEFFRGIENPIGIKVGPSMKPDELVTLLEKIEPQNRPGRVTLITRLGAGKVEEMLPAFIEAVQKAGRKVVWSSDPMHGNTFATEQGIKTRRFGDILQELIASFAVHKAHNSHLGGVHFELTGANVTECIGGAEDLLPEDLAAGYESYCDPRLNYGQSLEMAFLVAKHLSTE